MGATTRSSLQPAANIKVIVEKAANGKPIDERCGDRVHGDGRAEGKQEGSLEVKTEFRMARR